jgi:WhiB family transcriptional regulator, redox-sensing transcriptional regulator
MRESVLETDTTTEDGKWREEAACLHCSAILFFGGDDSEPQAERRGREEEAKRICACCVVREDCLQFALRSRESYGIWGGLTEIERRSILRKQRIP